MEEASETLLTLIKAQKGKIRGFIRSSKLYRDIFEEHLANAKNLF